MKRYFAFYGATYYPNEGMEDFVGDYDSIDDAIASIELKRKQDDCTGEWAYDWARIWDSHTRKNIWSDGEFEQE